ncbi:MAG: restriction endonuclease, partial [bacterium]
METDISLRSSTRKIIIDTKYYKEALKGNFNTEKVLSGHLYQLFSYIENQKKPDDPLTQNCEGILLYPTVKRSISKTLNLAT